MITRGAHRQDNGRLDKANNFDHHLDEQPEEERLDLLMILAVGMVIVALLVLLAVLF